MQLQSGEEPGGFGEGFFVFGLGLRVGDDASAGVEVAPARFADGGADDDAELAFEIKSEIAKATGVGAARDGLKFVNDFHGANFWSARDASTREALGEGGEMGGVAPQAAFDGRDEVLDLRVTLQPDKFRDDDGAVFTDATEIVTEQIGYHHQLGHFFGTGLEFVTQLRVSIGIIGARTRAFDRTRLDVQTAQAQKKLRGGRGDLKFAAIEVGGKRRGRDCGQALKDFPTIPISGRGEALREVDLINVTGSNVAQSAFDGGEEAGLRECGSEG